MNANLERHILCLANSRKYGERCIAGILLKSDQNEGFLPVIDQRGPVWVRPVTKRDNGAVPESEVADIQLLDIIRFEQKDRRPSGYQSENILYQKSSLTRVRAANVIPENLDPLCTSDNKLFGNDKTFLDAKEIQSCDHSLCLIKVPEVHASFKIKNKDIPWEEKRQYRMHFNYKNIHYNLPLTDVVLQNRIEAQPDLLTAYEHIYFCVSLSAPYQSQYFKLVAGIIML